MIYQWLILIVACACLFGIGYISKKDTAQVDTNNKFLVGGNKVGTLVGALSILATGFSGWGFIGSPGMAYEYGTIEILGNLMFGPAIILGAYCGATFLKKQDSQTIPEFLANSHPGSYTAKNAVRFFAALVCVVLLTIYLVGQIKAIGMLAHSWLNISHLQANILFMVIIVFITIQGGLLAVARTDTFMCIGMIISSLIIATIVFKDMSLTEMVASLEMQNINYTSPETSDPYGSGKYSVYLIFCYAFLFTTSLPYMSARFLSFKKSIKVHELLLVMAPVSIILSVVPFAGLYMKIKDPTLANPDYAMPAFINAYVPSQISGIITVFILFAILSTVSSILHSIVSSLAYDMRKSFNMPMTHSTVINAVATVLVAAVGILLTVVSPPMMLNKIAIIGTGGLISLLSGPTLAHFILPSNAWTAFVSMFVGIGCNIYLSFCSSLGWVEIPVFSSILGIVVYLIISYATKSKTQQA